MKLVFTICSNNYLAQAKTLADSVHKCLSDWNFVIGLVDEKTREVNYSELMCKVIPVGFVEPDIRMLAEKYSIVELNTCVKPKFFKYLFDTYSAEAIVYLDPDTCVYHSFELLESLLEQNDAVVTPHILTPIPLDGKTPAEELFLNYGIYNLGFLAVRNSAEVYQFLDWWQERTYAKGFDKPSIGLFTDQIWINHLPVFLEKVAILKNPGYNMAPWNLHERKLSGKGPIYLVNESWPLAFYHFSGFRMDKENDIHHDYNRFSLNDRPDLKMLYDDYRKTVKAAHFKEYAQLTCYYTELSEEKKIQNRKTDFQKGQRGLNYLSQYRKLGRYLSRAVPKTIRQFAINRLKNFL